MTAEPVPVRQLQPRAPRDLETICLKCLGKEPGRRYASALELAEDLRRFQADEPIVARPMGPAERTVKWVRRRPALAGLLLAVALALTALAAGGAWFTHELDRARREAEGLAVEEGKTREEAEKRLRQVEKANELLAGMFQDLGQRLEENGGPPLRSQLGKRLDRAAAGVEGDAVGDAVSVPGGNAPWEERS